MSDKCAINRRPFPPGEHGRRRVRNSEYRLQLREKQKIKRIYGLVEQQFRNCYQLSARQAGITGENLLRNLESRLDNVIYRSRFAASRSEARQLIRHGNFLVNGRKVNIPSYRLKSGDVFSLKENSREKERIVRAQEMSSAGEISSWLDVDSKSISGRVKKLPDRGEIDLSVREQLVVEFYSK
jgi:small subunit ribosomal protein S4